MLKDPLKKTVKGSQSNKNKSKSNQYDMIVFCHLRWQFVYQRPQHIISRMSKVMKVLMIEEPVDYNQENENSATILQITDSLHVLQARVSDIPSIANILPNYITNNNISIGWFYSPSFNSLLTSFNFDTVVYDCMDELSFFKEVPQELINQERELLAQVDIIFTAGKSLYESKSELHPNVYCFPSSVDESHFAKALNGIAVAAEISNIQTPIVGYCGVIDHQIDLSLLHETAKLLPNISFVMVGPLSKITKEELPQEENIHYLGMRSYNELPSYLKAFDIAMMPFAINDATKHLSPSKTLEYMAAGKPIISTEITDIIRDYSTCVSVIVTAEDFAESITFLLDKRDQLSLQMEYHDILKNTSWDATASTMQSIIAKFAI